MNFEISISCDEKTGDIYAVYFRIRDGEAADTREFADGAAFCDYDRQGRLLGVELLAPCDIKLLDQITRGEPKAKTFIKKSVPAHMVLSQ
jgi:hypothetical protein